MLAARLAHRVDGQRTEQKVKTPPMNSPTITLASMMLTTLSPTSWPKLVNSASAVSAADPDGKALAHRGRGVSHGIETIGDFAHAFGQLRHLGNAAGVVRHRAVCVHGDGHADGGQHAQSRQGHAEQVGDFIGQKHGAPDDQNGDDRRF